MRRVFVCLALSALCITGVTSQEKGKDKDSSDKEKKATGRKDPVGPVKEGMAFEGVLRTGELTKKGTLKDPESRNFTLVFETIDGEDFTGRWIWGTGIIGVDGKINKAGAFFLRYAKNIKGKSDLVFDGQMAGTVSATTLVGKYVRASGKRIGLAEAKIKMEKEKDKDK